MAARCGVIRKSDFASRVVALMYENHSQLRINPTSFVSNHSNPVGNRQGSGGRTSWDRIWRPGWCKRQRATVGDRTCGADSNRRLQAFLIHCAGEVVEGREHVNADGSVEIVEGDVFVSGAHVVGGRAVDVGGDAAPAPVAAVGAADADGWLWANATDGL